MPPPPTRTSLGLGPYVYRGTTLQVCYKPFDKPFAAVTCGEGPVPVGSLSVTRAMAAEAAETAEEAAAAAAAPVVCKVCQPPLPLRRPGLRP